MTKVDIALKGIKDWRSGKCGTLILSRSLDGLTDAEMNMVSVASRLSVVNLWELRNYVPADAPAPVKAK